MRLADKARLRNTLKKLAAGALLGPTTDGERARLEAAMAVRAAPFTSVNMCRGCAASTDGTARRMSRRYAELARALDAGFARTLAAACVIAGAA